ncbi:MAG: ATP-binding protein, partial [Acidimicrobiia bacterium]
QILVNLVDNGVKYTRNEGNVWIEAKSDDDAVRIEVRDDGPGIAAKHRARVFERFYRADTARASSNGGAGLGLAIAQWIVDLHGGDIHPETREPHGCRMVVTLPNHEEYT